MISIVINTYNAAKHLERVLESVKNFDEVVICDMESTDNTIAIAKSYGCKIVAFPKNGHTIVEPARNFAIQAATHPWVLVVDADETVPEELRKYLYRHIAQPIAAEGIYIPRRNYFMGRFMHSLYPDYILRFFKKDKVNWPPIIHTQPKINGNVIYAPRNKGLDFEHLANDSISTRLRKTDIYTSNECVKKAGKNYRALACIVRPTHRFLKNYIVKGGYRDGFPGFLYACLEATYQLVMIGKLKERKHKKHDTHSDGSVNAP